MIKKVPRAIGAVAILGLLIGAIATPLASQDYEVTAVMPGGNPNLSEGSPVYVDGFQLGTIESIEPEDNKAVVTFTLDRDVAPLHSGAKVSVQWKGLVGERLLYVTDGPRANAEIPSGGLVEGDNPAPVELGDVLAALDPQTRRHLGSLVGRLEGTLDGHEDDLAKTVRAAGPTLGALGEVLRGIGADGPAIRSLVTKTNQLMKTIDGQSADVQGVISDLSQTVNTTAGKRDQLRKALAKLPRTLRTAESVLGEVPDTTQEALPLLKDLADATKPLPSASKNLTLLLRDLRPLVAELKPTLRSASVLLDYTPGLLDSAHATVPDITKAIKAYAPALDFLRPYTPEAVGFLSTWGAAAKNYDANGRYMRIHGQAGGTSLNANPGFELPGFSQDTTPDPGAPGGIPQTDAEGKGMN